MQMLHIFCLPIEPGTCLNIRLECDDVQSFEAGDAAVSGLPS